MNERQSAELGRQMKTRLARTLGDHEQIPCRICGQPTPMLGTELCDRCWELEGRIKRDPDIARNILAALDAQQRERRNQQIEAAEHGA